MYSLLITKSINTFQSNTCSTHIPGFEYTELNRADYGTFPGNKYNDAMQVPAQQHHATTPHHTTSPTELYEAAIQRAQHS